MACLKIKDDEGERVVELDKPAMVVGRSKENEVFVKSSQSSRRHCQIEHVEQGYKLIDLESRNGTKVNGKFVNQHLLMHGDKIMIGDAVLEFDDPASVTGRTAPVESPGQMEQVARQHVRDNVMAEQARRSQAKPAVAPEERAHRYARRRQDRTFQSLAMLGGVIVGAVGLMLAYRHLNQEHPDVTEGRQFYEKAVDLKDSNPELAVDCLGKVKRTSGEWYRKAQELRIALGSRIVDQRNELSAEAQAEYAEVEQLWTQFPNRYQEIVAKIDAYLQKHEAHLPEMYLTTLKEERAKARAGLDKRGTMDIGTLDERLKPLLKEHRFAEALTMVKTTQAKYPDPKLSREIEERKTGLIEEADKYFTDQDFKAQLAFKAGKTDEADEAYQRLLSAFKVTQGEDHSEFAAKLEKIRERQGRKP